jgi:DNA-binding PadR family transcriptional regulator
MRHRDTHHDHQYRHGHDSQDRGGRRFAHSPTSGEDLHRGGGRHRRGGDRHEAPLGEGPPGEEHRGRRRQRVFDHGDLRFVLLGMIAARPAHGYDLIKTLEERMGGGYSPSPGAIYPTLTMLEEQGYAAISAEDGKKLYRATAEGEAFLKANQTAIDAIQARIDGVARERGMVPDPRIIRAIENLKTALRLRIAGGPIADERVRAIAAAIDAAAAEAERI